MGKLQGISEGIGPGFCPSLIPDTKPSVGLPCAALSLGNGVPLQRHLTYCPASCRFRCERNAWWLLCCTLATKHSASAIVDVFNGRTISSNILSCDTVSAGAFFPQADFYVPEKAMGQHAGEHVVMPSWVFSDFIVVHAQFRLGFLKALFNRPAYAA